MPANWTDYSNCDDATLYGVNVVYDSWASLTELTGDGDAFVDQGEKWSVDVTLVNAGNMDATNVEADLSGSGMTVCDNPGVFGDMAHSSAEPRTVTFEFVVDDDYTDVNGCPATLSGAGEGSAGAVRRRLKPARSYQGLSFQPRMKPTPRHHRAAFSGFWRAYSRR